MSKMSELDLERRDIEDGLRPMDMGTVAYLANHLSGEGHWELSAIMDMLLAEHMRRFPVLYRNCDTASQPQPQPQPRYNITHPSPGIAVARLREQEQRRDWSDVRAAMERIREGRKAWLATGDTGKESGVQGELDLPRRSDAETELVRAFNRWLAEQRED